VMDEFCMERKVDEAVKLFAEMNETGIVSTITTYSIIIKGYSIIGNLMHLLRFLRSWKKNVLILMSSPTTLSLIYSVSKNC
ncbi:hypothetical protein FGF99_25485, partial [Salmonella sp. gx-f8]|nr:hypothetical protein [Salmonella sp. gx-f8]